MTTLIVDASIAIKWVIEEDGTPHALALRTRARLAAPEFLVAECANILWKKVRRDELSADEASLAARLIERADVELMPMRSSLDAATRLAIELDHAAYDCVYLALAVEKDWPFVTADERFLRKLHQSRLRGKAISLAEAAASRHD
jgi:predicted nucleic acid-binding protein